MNKSKPIKKVKEPVQPKEKLECASGNVFYGKDLEIARLEKRLGITKNNYKP